MNYIPPIKFSTSIDYDANNIYYFLIKGGEKRRELIYKRIPYLKDKFNKGKNKREKIKIIKLLIAKIYKERRFRNNLKIFEKEWGKIHQPLLMSLSELMKTNWHGIKEIKAYLAANPICPRYLKTNEFSIWYDFPKDIAVGVIFHEITHFLYFKKWSQLFPQDSQKTYEPLHLNWLLSEILAVVVNNDERFKRYVLKPAKGYEKHLKIKVKYKNKKCNLVQYFQYLYNDYRKKNITFDDFLRASRQEIKKLYKKYRWKKLY